MITNPEPVELDDEPAIETPMAVLHPRSDIPGPDGDM